MKRRFMPLAVAAGMLVACVGDNDVRLHDSPGEPSPAGSPETTPASSGTLDPTFGTGGIVPLQADAPSSLVAREQIVLATMTGSVFVFDADGRLASTLGPFGSWPRVAIDATGRILILDPQSETLLRYDQAGHRELATVPKPEYPVRGDLAIAPGGKIVVGLGNVVSRPLRQRG